jgi:hypothetical protein
MIKCGDSIRFTQAEIDKAAELGIDFREVKTKAGHARSVIELITTLAEERPDLLEKIARKAAAKKGVNLPPKLTAV